MVSKDDNYQETMGSDIVGFYDVSMMNEHYDFLCPRESSAQCQNGGYPNPNNCTVCNCPSGYGGVLCNERAPVGTRVEVRIESLQGYTVDGCIYGGVEIKAHPDQLRTGYRFCSSSSVGKTLTASSNLLPIITFNRYGRTTVGLVYRYVDFPRLVGLFKAKEAATIGCRDCTVVENPPMEGALRPLRAAAFSLSSDTVRAAVFVSDVDVLVTIADRDE
ncbi:hypothetical protein TELCIR_18274 [Teladorsagia circumcincta]|uniref:Peptidase M12A domain-containing protein n=1 Tax=Teladorsagia circumcincta TaxID=45464 RepID=A0A2G9TQG7_TELCI|nr:hypothetical protein TELCIR_18274 [Teladorsagia circumcincta]